MAIDPIYIVKLMTFWAAKIPHKATIDVNRRRPQTSDVKIVTPLPILALTGVSLLALLFGTRVA